MRHRFLAGFALLLVVTLAFTACGKSGDFDEHASDSGLVLETFLPKDLGLVLSYSMRDQGQFDVATQFSKEWANGLQEEFASGQGELLEAVQPALGDRYRWIFGSKPTVQNKATAYSVLTLEDSKKMEGVLDGLVSKGQLQVKELGSSKTYVDEKQPLYFTLHEDLLLASNDAEELLKMTEIKEEDNLWNSELYQDGLKKFGPEFLFYGMLFPGVQGNSGPAVFGKVMKSQVLVVKAETEGLKLDAYMSADEAAAKEAKISFDDVPRSKPYLHKDIAADGLVAYIESFGLKQSLMAAEKAAGAESILEPVTTFFRQYFSLDFEKEFLSFMDKGYSFGVTKNGESVVPGFALNVDVSSAPEDAEAFLNKLDGQITGLLTVLQSALPGAVTKTEESIDGADYKVLTLDLSGLQGVAAAGQIPAVLTEQPIVLRYGLNEDRLTVSTVLAEDGDSLADSELYSKLSAKIAAKEGLILVDTQALASYIDLLQSLRSDLQLDNGDQSLMLKQLLQAFSGAIFSGEASANESHINGYLMLAQ